MKSCCLAAALLIAAGPLLSRAAAPAPAVKAPVAKAVDGRIRTQLMAKNAVTIAGELSAKIARLPFNEGASFRRGQVLVEFECSSYRAQLRKATATLDAARLMVKGNQRLAELNSIGTLEVEQSVARVKEAAAEVSYMETVVAKCTIAAPFNGRVARRSAAAYQYVSPGNPVMDILDTSQLELRMVVPSRWLGWLRTGARFTVQVDELNRSYAATVVRIGAQIDPLSQSVLAIGVIEGRDDALLPGMSGWATLVPK